jgi:hypothetical protein
MGYSSALGLQTQHLDWGFSSVTEGEFSMGEALGLIPNTKKNKIKKREFCCIAAFTTEVLTASENMGSCIDRLCKDFPPASK